MMALAAAGLGWLVGLAAPGSDRRLRAWCVLAALLPEADTLAFLGGAKAQAVFRYGFTHNVFFAALLLGAAIWFFRGEPARRLFTALLLGVVSFALHLAADLKIGGAE